jgi:hypothetical protein
MKELKQEVMFKLEDSVESRNEPKKVPKFWEEPPENGRDLVATERGTEIRRWD